MTDTSKEWVESIECEKVNTKTSISDDNYSGILLVPTRYGKEENKVSYIKLNINTEKLIYAKKIIIYTLPSGSTDYRDLDSSLDIKLDLQCNGKEINNMPNLPSPYTASKTKTSIKGTEDCSTIQSKIDNNQASTVTWTSPEITTEEPLKSIEILAYLPSKYEPYYGLEKIFAVAIEYDKNITVGVNEIEEESANLPTEYYDLMGRKLNNAPQSGLYIRKNGSKVLKLMAQ